MCHALKGNSKRKVFLAAPDCHPQNLEVLRTRAKPLGIEMRVGESAFDETMFGVLLQYPATDGAVTDPSAVIAAAHEAGAMVVWQPIYWYSPS